jgi:hypothetical protein
VSLPGVAEAGSTGLAPLCVVGMHRSGSSLVTRMLAELGVDLGPQSSMFDPDPIDNPAGYFEQKQVVELDDQLLGALGGHASEPPIIRLGWELSDELKQPARDARVLLATLFSREPWGFKDPRASLLLPFWRTVEPRLRVIICVRNPLEVAQSMARRDDPYPLEHWLENWRRHTDAAFAGSADTQRIVVLYEDLLEAPLQTARLLAEFIFGVTLAAKEIERAAALPDPESRRTAVSDDELLADDRVPDSIAREYFALRDRARAT